MSNSGFPQNENSGSMTRSFSVTNLEQTSWKQVAVNQAWSLMLKIGASELLDGFAVASVTTQTIADAIQARRDSLQHFGQRSIRPKRNIENMLMI